MSWQQVLMQKMEYTSKKCYLLNTFPELQNGYKHCSLNSQGWISKKKPVLRRSKKLKLLNVTPNFFCQITNTYCWEGEKEKNSFLANRKQEQVFNWLRNKDLLRWIFKTKKKCLEKKFNFLNQCLFIHTFCGYFCQ